MILYYSKKACSQAPHIILHETDLAHDSVAVDLKSKETEDGRNYYEVNPKGVVPALELSDGNVVTENAVVLQYIAERAGADELLPPPGTLDRYRVLEWLNFVATELHKGFGPLFKAEAGEEAKRFARDLVMRKLDFAEQQLGSGPYLMGEGFTLPDAYLFVILGWVGMLDTGLDRWPNLQAFRERMEERPSVRQVLEFEGLVKEPVAG
jgi:glutathione S-transferase